MEKHFDYIDEANVTASNKFYGEMITRAQFQRTLSNAIHALKQLDVIKKAFFYGRNNEGLIEPETGELTCSDIPASIDAVNFKRGELLMHAMIGHATESGEQLELLWNSIFNGAAFDDVNFIEEVGDAFWYAAIGLKQLDAAFNDVQRRNIAKLRHRFPQQFTEYDANNRDLFGERKILEMQSKPQKSIDHWEIHNNRLRGLVGDDFITTSEVISLDERAGICETQNSYYKLGIKVDHPMSKPDTNEA